MKTHAEMSVVNAAAVRPSAGFASLMGLCFTLDFWQCGAHAEAGPKETLPKMNFPLSSVPLKCGGPNRRRQCDVGGVMILALN